MILRSAPRLAAMDLPSSNDEPAGVLLDELLESLLDDFRNWFARGVVLLDHCHDAVMAEVELEDHERSGALGGRDVHLPSWARAEHARRLTANHRHGG